MNEGMDAFIITMVWCWTIVLYIAGSCWLFELPANRYTATLMILWHSLWISACVSIDEVFGAAYWV